MVLAFYFLVQKKATHKLEKTSKVGFTIVDNLVSKDFGSAMERGIPSLFGSQSSTP